MGYGDDEGNGKDGSCGLLGLGGLTLARKMRCGAAGEAPVPGLGKREEGRVALG
jgi:hypothetical protein